MDIRDFVSDVLIQIVEGITLAQEKTSQSNAIISPRIYRNECGHVSVSHSEMNSDACSLVSFDISVKVTETKSDQTGANGGAQIRMAVFSVGGDASKGKQNIEHNSNTSHIKFEIAVKWPEKDASSCFVALEQFDAETEYDPLAHMR